MKSFSTRMRVGSLALLGSTILAPMPALAQAAADQAVVSSEIVVTAQRREERQVDVPITITTLGPKTLENAGVQQLGDIARVTPSLRFDSAGTFFQPTIRGVGTAITTSGGGPNVGIYTDGFFQSNPETADFQLMRVQSIQVLKGPQGTLFGRNTTGGAIIVTTADPSTTTAAEAKVSYGRFNSVKLQGYATTGLGSNVAMDIEGVLNRGDGFVTNIVNNDRKAGKYRNWSVRTGIKADISDSVSVLLRYTHSDTNDPTAILNPAYVDTSGNANFFKQVTPAGMAAYAAMGFGATTKGVALVNLALSPQLYASFLPFLKPPFGTAFPANWTTANPAYATDPNTIASSKPVSFTNKSNTFQGTIKADLGFANLASYTQYRKDKAVNFQDLDNSAADFFHGRLGIDNETFSQEFLLSSKAGGKLQWTAGINYFQNRDTYHFGFAGPPQFPYGGSSTMTKSYAAFVDATYEFITNTFVTVGGRYSHDTVTEGFFYIPLTGPGTEAGQTKVLVPDLTNNRFTPRVVLRYKPSDRSSIYASWTRGYKAGILNVGGGSLLPIRPESIDAFEVGAKYDDRAISLDLATFYYKYNDLQVSSFQAGQAQIRNAAKSEIYGIEGSARYRVTDALNLSAGFAWVHARYKSFPNAPYYGYCDPSITAAQNTAGVQGYCANGAGGLTQYTVNATGYHMQRSPDFTASVQASYTVPVADGGLTLSSTLYYTSKVYLDPTQQFEQNGYALVSLRAQWEDPSKHFTVAVYGDNVTNQRYKSVISYNTIGTGVAWSSPTTYGVQFGAKF